jgi:mannose-6-phosphate isomerase-like protein (cupin superfamily)
MGDILPEVASGQVRADPDFLSRETEPMPNGWRLSALGHIERHAHLDYRKRVARPATATIAIQAIFEEPLTMPTVTQTGPYIASYKDSKDFWLAGGLARVLGESSKTDGAFSLIHLTHQYGEATPLHIHHNQDEALFVFHGEVRGVCGDTEWEALGGAFIWLPRGLAHAYQAVGELPLEILVMSIPGGFDAFVAEAGTSVTEGAGRIASPSDPAQLAEIAARYDIEILGPPVNFLG